MSDEPKDGLEVELEERQLYAFRYVPDRAAKPPKEWPFACVVALRKGERLANGQWCCLHVFICKDGIFEFAEGMFGTDTEITELYGPVTWPEIVKALSVIPQDYRGPLGSKAGEMPFERVERLHRHGVSFPLIGPDAEGRVLKALRVTEMWDRWMKAKRAYRGPNGEGWTFAVCLKDLYEPAKLAALGPLAESHGNRLKQFCHEIGLHPDRSALFKTRMCELKGKLVVIKARYKITYRNQQVR